MNAVESWLLEKLTEKLIAMAESPETKAWVMSKLKAADEQTKTKMLKVVLEAVEGFLAAPAA